MSPHAHHHHHGHVWAGRLMVAIGCVLVLGANFLIFREASLRIEPSPARRMISVITLLWMFAGAWLMCARMIWGRFLVLFILYAGSLGYFLGGVIGLTAAYPWPLLRVRIFFIASGVYLFISLVLTHSRHVRRLTSRMWE